MASRPISRRDLLRGVAAAGAVLGLPSIARAQAGGGPATARTRLILLGTGGGPRPSTQRWSNSQVIVANGVPYVIDCGNGVAIRLTEAGVPLASLRHVFVTHHHSDHNADYGNLLLLAWTAGLRTRIDTWGPPPIAKITRLFFEMNAYDIETRIADEGRVPLLPLVNVHEMSQGGLVVKRNGDWALIRPGVAATPACASAAWAASSVPAVEFTRSALAAIC